ncbi:MAG: hypothetical protein WCL06_11435 [Bacteroidota bacterium]
MALVCFLLYLAAFFVYTSINISQQGIYLSEANTIINYLSPLFYAAAFILPGIIIGIKLKKTETA